MWVRGLFSLSSHLWKWGARPWGPRVDGQGEGAQGECDGGAAWTSGPVLLQNLLASRCDHTPRSLFGEAVSAAGGGVAWQPLRPPPLPWLNSQKAHQEVGGLSTTSSPQVRNWRPRQTEHLKTERRGLGPVRRRRRLSLPPPSGSQPMWGQ